MMEYQNTLLKLTDCTFREGKNIDKVTREIEPCRHCYLTKNPDIYTKQKRYPLVFFQKKRKISLMVISRDPNTFYKDLETPKKNTTPDFIKWLINKIADNEKEYDNVIKAKSSSYYWTHIAKCYSANENGIAKKGSDSCYNILKSEMEYLKPKYIIGLGNGVGNLLKKIGKIKKYEFEKMLSMINDGGNLSKTIILPHPSGVNGRWKYNLEKTNVRNTETNISYSMKNLFDKLGSRNPRIKRGVI